MQTTGSFQRQAGLAGRQAPDHLPRLLPAGFAADPARLAEHLARYGPPPSSGLVSRGSDAYLCSPSQPRLAAGRADVGLPYHT